MYSGQYSLTYSTILKALDLDLGHGMLSVVARCSADRYLQNRTRAVSVHFIVIILYYARNATNHTIAFQSVQ